MAVSRLDIANYALSHLVRDSIRDLDGSDPRAVQTKNNMDRAIEGVIAEYDWAQCRVVSLLIAVDYSELRGWTYAYAVPSDAVRVWGVGDYKGETLSKFALGMSADIDSTTNYIFADDAAPTVRYGSRRANLSRFTPDVIELMGLKLAISTCMVLTKNAQLRVSLKKEYDAALSAAKTAAANLEPEVHDTEFTPELILVRSQ